MINAENLSKTFKSGKQKVDALTNIGLKIDKGTFTLIKGASGCGKSTLLFCMGGLLLPNSGQVVIDGKNIYDISNKTRIQYCSKKIGFVFQSYYLIPYLTVAENIMAVNQVDGIQVNDEVLFEIAERLNIKHRLNHIPAELSIGEKQRTSLARAMIIKLDVILADEPTGNLDPDNASEVLKILDEFKSGGGTVVMVTHGTEADEFADRQIILKEGMIVNDKINS